jgi:MscS family membrane protein
MNALTVLTDLYRYLFQVSSDPKIWLTQVFVVVLVTVTCNFFLMRVLDAAGRGVAKTESLWDDALLEAARIPVRLFVWTVGLTVAAKVLTNATESSLLALWPEVRSMAYIVIVTLFFTRFITFAEANVIDAKRVSAPMDHTTAKAIAKLLRLSVMITAFLVALQTLGYSISGVLAFGGVGGVAVGFAAKDLLANFFGGLMIYLDKPFSVGEWVRSPDREIEGTVEDIGWRLTRIRTFDKRPLYIPNSMFASIVVENPSRMQHRRIYENIGIRYEDAHVLHAVVNDVREMLKNHPDVAQTQTQIVHFNAYAASHLEFMVYAFTVTTDWLKYHAVKEDVLTNIMAIVQHHGAQFAYPTHTVHMAETVAERVAASEAKHIGGPNAV